MIIFASCYKRDYYPDYHNDTDWMRTHDHGVVAYVDYPTGNYIVDMHNGFAVVDITVVQPPNGMMKYMPTSTASDCKPFSIIQ